MEIAAPFHFLDVSNRSVVVLEGETSEATTIFLRSVEDAAILSGRIIDLKTRTPLSNVRVKVECVSKVCGGLSGSSNKGGKFVISLNQVSNTNTNTNNATKDKDIITQFESVDEDSGATGNLTDKSAAHCAGGVCTIY